MNYRRAQSIEDFQQILTLQQQNLAHKLSVLEKKDGFLSAEFTLQQLQEMNEDSCIMTCFDNDILCGYIATSSVEYNKQFPLLSSMIDAFDTISYKGKPLNSYKSFISGPACVDKKYRGQRIYFNLIHHVLNFLKHSPNPPELKILFVAANNSASNNAQQKVGMEMVGRFEFNSEKYLIYVMSLSV